MNHNFDSHELEGVGNQSINQSNNQPTSHSRGQPDIIKVNSPQMKTHTRAFYQDAPLLQNEDKSIIPRYLV
jgi:hypothetical protein